MRRARVLVEVRDGDVALALKRLKRQVDTTGLSRELRAREYAVSPGLRRRRKHERAVLAQRKRRRRALAFDFPDKPIKSAGPGTFRPMPPSLRI